MRRAVSRFVPLVLTVIGPTLVVPIEAWHHHDDHGNHESCALCVTAAVVVADVPNPAVVVLSLFAVLDVVPAQREVASLDQPQSIARGPPGGITLV